MSFLTAALYGLGAFGQGRQQRQNYQLEQQRQADTHAYEQAQTQAEQARVAIEQANAKRQETVTDVDLRARGLGPDGKPLPPLPVPPSLMRVVPGKVGPNYKATIDDQIAHQLAWAKHFADDGRTDLAQPYYDQAKALQVEKFRQMNSTDTLNRELTLRSIPQAPTYADLHGGPPPQFTSAQDWYLRNYGQPGPPRAPASSKAPAIATKQAGQAFNDFKQLWTNYTKVPAGPISGIAPLDPVTKKPMTSQLNPAQQQQLQEDFAQLDASPNPAKDVEGMLKGVKNDKVVKALKAYAKYRAAQKHAEDLTNAEDTGGSDASGNPQSPWP